MTEEINTLVKLAKAVIEHAPEGGDAFWDIKFSDIEAALSAAEPVAWLVRLYANDGSLIDERVYREKPDIRSTARTDFIPLYAAPPAPSVALKALEWGRGTTISRCATITGTYHATFDKHEWQLSFQGVGKTASFNVSRHPNRSAAENEAQKIHEKALSPYLSEQVQDVAGWQSMDTAPKDGSEFAAGRRYSPDGEFVVHSYRWVGAPNYWLSKRNGVCIRPSYQADYKWCPLPAAPAKQEGG